MKKKVLIVNDKLISGGVEKVMFDITTNLPTDKYNITILTEIKDKRFYETYPNTIKYMYMDFFGNLSPKTKILRRINRILKKIFYIKLIKKIESEKFNIAISIKEGDSMKFVSALNIEKKIAWVHVNYHDLYWTKYVFGNTINEINCMKTFSKVVCVTNAVKNSIIETIGDPGNLCVIYNPIDSNVILDKSNEEVEFQPSAGKLIFVTVGRLCAEKGIERIIKIYNNLIKKYDFEIYIIGGTDDKEYERKLIDLVDNDNSGSIFFMGDKKNPYPYVKKADCFICASITESYGLAIQEALILGTPVIMTNCPGAAEIFDEKTDGIIVENSEEGLYLQIEEILKKPDIIKDFKDKLKSKPKDNKLKNTINAVEELLK